MRRVVCIFSLSAWAFCSAARSVNVAPPEMPRSYVDTFYTPPPGATIRTVPAGGDLQKVLNAAQMGDIIELQAGATYYGNFKLPNKTGAGWIVIRSSQFASLPAAGRRVTPAHASLMPKLVTKNAAEVIAAHNGAHHYRFVGIEITTESQINYNLVLLGNGEKTLDQIPHHFVIDRCYIHGDPTRTVRRAIALNSAETAVINSYISDCHEVGADSQAVCGWNGPGPFKIVNNYLEGAGENIIFGGSDPSVPNLVPSDIEIRRNHIYKPLTWYTKDASYAGTHWTVKNLFELKNARRIWVEGNVMENCWGDGQSGFAIVLTPRNQSGTAPWSSLEDLIFEKNIIRHTGSGVNLLGTDNTHPSQSSKRIVIRNNFFGDINGAVFSSDGRIFQFVTPPRTDSAAKDVLIEHNTMIFAKSGNSFITAGDKVVVAEHWIFRNNITPRGQYGLFGSGKGEGNAALDYFFLDYDFVKNAVFGNATVSSKYPAGNFFPATRNDVGFVDLSHGNYRLLDNSPYRNAGTDGKDLGVDFDALQKATAGTVSGNWADEASVSHSASANYR